MNFYTHTSPIREPKHPNHPSYVPKNPYRTGLDTVHTPSPSQLRTSLAVSDVLPDSPLPLPPTPPPNMENRTAEPGGTKRQLIPVMSPGGFSGSTPDNHGTFYSVGIIYSIGQRTKTALKRRKKKGRGMGEGGGGLIKFEFPGPCEGTLI